jgi:hypothetical protein
MDNLLNGEIGWRKAGSGNVRKARVLILDSLTGLAWRAPRPTHADTDPTTLHLVYLLIGIYIILYLVEFTT